MSVDVAANSAVLAAVRAVCGAESMPSYLMAILENAAQPGIDCASFSVVDPTGEWHVLAGVGDDSARVSAFSSESPTAAAMAELERGEAIVMETSAGAAEISVPIIAQGSLIGSVTFRGAREWVVTADDVELLSQIVRMTSGALVMMVLLESEQRANARLVELEEMKVDFINMVAHDLRSPLTLICGYAKMLAGSELDSARAEMVTTILRSADRMNALVDDVLALGSLDGRPRTMQLVALDLVAVVREVAASAVAPVAVHVSTADNCALALADEQSVIRVVTNLLSNATKYARSTVDVHLDRVAGWVRVTVTDDGPGVAPGDLSRLFTKFGRVPAADGSLLPSGTGLGLYICKTFVEAMGGSVWVTSEPGIRTTFGFVLHAAL